MMEFLQDTLCLSDFGCFVFIIFPFVVLAGRMLYRLVLEKAPETPLEMIKNYLKCLLIAYLVFIGFIILGASGILETICTFGKGICLLLLPLAILGF